MPIAREVILRLDCDHEPEICIRHTAVIRGATMQLAKNEARRQGWYLSAEKAFCSTHHPLRNLTVDAARPAQASVPEPSHVR